jgi:hypothetical protein
VGPLAAGAEVTGDAVGASPSSQSPQEATHLSAISASKKDPDSTQYLPVRLAVFLFVNQSQPTLLPKKLSSNMKSLVSSHVTLASQLAEQASMIEGSPQYMAIRFAELLLFSQAQFTVFVVTNRKSLSSALV